MINFLLSVGTSTGTGLSGDAAFTQITGDIKKYLGYVVVGIIGLIGLVAVVFAIYVAFRLAKAEDEGKRKEAKNQLIWSIIGIISAILIFTLIQTVFSQFLNPTTPNSVGDDTVGQAINTVLAAVANIVGIIMNMGTIAGALFGIYIAFRLATAQDEGKRKQAKAQLMWTLIAIIAVIVLNSLIGQILGSLSTAVQSGVTT